MEYDISTCRLKRFTSSEAKKCLSGHHMLLIGDSVTRYQYISLIYFLEHGKWPPRFGVPREKECMHHDHAGNPTCSPKGEPSVVMEGDWAEIYGHAAEKSWKQMHLYLGGKGFNGNLECQCQRGANSIENMFYETKNITTPTDPDFKDDFKPVKVTFLNDLPFVPMRGWKRSHCSATSSCHLTSEWWDDASNKTAHGDYDWQYSIANKPEDKFEIFEGLESSGLAPDVDLAIYNRGLWVTAPSDFSQAEKMFAGMFKMTQKRKGKCFWKGTTAKAFSTTFKKEENYLPITTYEREMRLRFGAYSAGCGVYDLAFVTQQFEKFEWMGDVGRPSCCGDSEMMTNVFWDLVHYHPWVYEEFNTILLNMLC
jgi:hypothetical protein